MTIKYEVEVTQRDIEEGKTRDCSGCPVALAIARAMEVPRVNVANEFFVIDPMADIGSKYRQEILLPPKVTEFIRAFDKRQPVVPFTFELVIP